MKKDADTETRKIKYIKEKEFEAFYLSYPFFMLIQFKLKI